MTDKIGKARIIEADRLLRAARNGELSLKCFR